MDPDPDLDLDPDPNWAKFLDPDLKSMYLEQQHCPQQQQKIIKLYKRSETILKLLATV